MVTNESNMVVCPFCGKKNRNDSDICMFCRKPIMNGVNKKKMPIYHDNNVDNVTYNKSVFFFKFFGINILSVFPIILLISVIWLLFGDYQITTTIRVIECIVSCYLVSSVIGIIFFGMNMIFKQRIYTIAKAITIVCGLIGAVLPIIFDL